MKITRNRNTTIAGLAQAGNQKYMKRAIFLARKGMGNVSPNPMVGAVLVKN